MPNPETPKESQESREPARKPEPPIIAPPGRDNVAQPHKDDHDETHTEVLDSEGHRVTLNKKPQNPFQKPSDLQP